MYKVFKYRLYPTKQQLRRLDDLRETCRHWYNYCLEQRKSAFTERGVSIGRYDQYQSINQYRATNPWAAEVNTTVLRSVVDDLDRAFAAFFRRFKSGQKPGFPRFKGKNRLSSVGFKQYGNGCKIDGRRLRISGVGRIAVRWHRPVEGQIKTLRLVKTFDQWYACLTCSIEPQALPTTGKDVGIDIGITHLLTTSDGEHIPNPRWYRTAEANIKRLQRKVSRCTKDSNNRRKAIVQLRRAYQKIVYSRHDYLNKLVHRLVVTYDRIALENIRIDKLVYNRRLAKSILDAGWGYFTQHLTRKAAEAGRTVCFVHPAYTSRSCSSCGYRFENQTLTDRWITCGCGLSLDRDHNAAINVLNRAGHVRWSTNLSIDKPGQEAATFE